MIGGSSGAWFFITDWYTTSATSNTLDAISFTLQRK
jgi:hypothetical protein